MIPAMAGSMDVAVDRHLDVVDWPTQIHRLGTHIASTCTGVLLLDRASGREDRNDALGVSPTSSEEMSLVRLRPEVRNITDEGDLYCSGGSSSCMDERWRVHRKTGWPLVMRYK